MADTSESTDGVQYDAFISYSHADLRLAERVSRRIRRYRPPRNLGLPKRPLVPFRDVEQLTASADLSESLVSRLHASRHLIVLCSPTAAQSKYVNDEIDVFVEQRGPTAIVTVLCAGEPETSFPRPLRELLEEPLFIDLRGARRNLRSYFRFRGQTLRIIAFLYGIDYSRLAREDEHRRRRQRNLSVLVTLFIALVVAAGFLINSVSQELWAPIDLPESGREIRGFSYGNELLPIREIAVNNRDPSILIYPVRDAEFHGQKPPQGLIWINRVQSEFDEFSFHQQALEQFSQHEGLLLPSEPIAIFRFEIEGDFRASGESQFFNTLDSERGEPAYYQLLLIARTGEDGPASAGQFIVPAKRWGTVANRLIGSSEFETLNWPTEVLKEKGLLPASGRIQGTIKNLLDDSEARAEYRIVDAWDEFLDAIGPERFDMLLASNTPELVLDFDGETSRLADLSGSSQEVWDEIKTSPDWTSYSKPLRPSVNSSDVEHNADETAARLEASLRHHVDRSDVESYEDFSVTRVAREVTSGRVQAATLMGRNFPTVASAATAIQVHRVFLYCGAEHQQWHEITLPTINTDSQIADIVPLDGQGLQTLLVVEGDGLFRTRDGGKTWEEFNLDENRLITNGQLKTLVVGSPPTVFVLVDNDITGEGNARNHLLRLKQQSWMERLRLGLIRLLSSPADLSRG